MNPLSIPTDNLYKFLAITGIVLLISSNAFYYFASERLHDNNSDFRRKSGVSLFERQELLEEINTDNKRINELEETLQNPTLMERESILRDISSEQDKVRVASQKLTEVKKSMVDLINAEDINWKKLEYNIAGDILYVGTGSGFLTMIVGFYFWYTKLQRYQDKIIKQKV